jgi:hypothetical protein
MSEWNPSTQPPAYPPILAPVDRDTARVMGWITLRFAAGLAALSFLIAFLY